VFVKINSLLTQVGPDLDSESSKNLIGYPILLNLSKNLGCF